LDLSQIQALFQAPFVTSTVVIKRKCTAYITSALFSHTVRLKTDPFLSQSQGEEMLGAAASASAENKSAVEGGFFEKGGNGLSANNSIDPFKLIPGEYVVHRRIGIGKFQGIRSIAIDPDPINPLTGEVIGRAPKIGFLFIDFADQQVRPCAFSK
jgi:hypothetical protein